MEFFKFKLFHQVKHVLDNETIDLNFVYPFKPVIFSQKQINIEYNLRFER